MPVLEVGFRCGACGSPAPRWVGRCSACGGWDTLVEAAARRARAAPSAECAAPVPLASACPTSPPRDDSAATGVAELDRVLGGGLVAGSVTLLGGAPGIGKSTLLVQAAGGLARSGSRCLYVAGEESAAHVAARAGRVGATGAIDVLETDDVDDVVAVLRSGDVEACFLDSIQTITDRGVSGVPGSVAQVRECTQAVVRAARTSGSAVVLAGHVTKEGGLAGPRALEHLVDTVLTLEGDRHHALRLLRVPKHRFGSTSELGVFEMGEAGLVGVADPSALLLGDRRPDVAGSIVAPVIDGSRPLLVEVQALVTGASSAMPRRSVRGLDAGRLALLLAVLEERVGIPFERRDVYASVAGGVRVTEPGLDLALVLAVAGAAAGRVAAGGLAALGEVGLAGEVRNVAHAERRLAEAVRLGVTSVVGPPGLPPHDGLEVREAVTVGHALAAAGLT